MLQYGNGYVYIDGQGYILEISDQKIDKPIIKGYSTPEGDLQLGNRLKEEDLQRLDTVIKIADALDMTVQEFLDDKVFERTNLDVD